MHLKYYYILEQSIHFFHQKRSKVGGTDGKPYQSILRYSYVMKIYSFLLLRDFSSVNNLFCFKWALNPLLTIILTIWAHLKQERKFNRDLSRTIRWEFGISREKMLWIMLKNGQNMNVNEESYQKLIWYYKTDYNIHRIIYLFSFK